MRTASIPTPAYDAAAADLGAFARSSAGRRYTYGFALDAASGLIVVDTDAPAEVADAVDARHPGVFRFRRGEGFRLLPEVGRPGGARSRYPAALRLHQPALRARRLPRSRSAAVTETEPVRASASRRSPEPAPWHDPVVRPTLSRERSRRDPGPVAPV